MNDITTNLFSRPLKFLLTSFAFIPTFFKVEEKKITTIDIHQILYYIWNVIHDIECSIDKKVIFHREELKEVALTLAKSEQLIDDTNNFDDAFSFILEKCNKDVICCISDIEEYIEYLGKEYNIKI